MIAGHTLPMKNRFLPALVAVFAALVLTILNVSAQSEPPPLPADPFLDSYSFLDTNWLSDFGYAPIKDTNLFCIPEWGGTGLWLDTTNEIPAFLNYNVVETNGHQNLDLAAGGVLTIVIPDWASADTNQNGQGPGQLGFLVAAGDWSSGSPHGFWAIYVDAGGTNIYFGGVSNSVSTTYVSAPISWASNSIHEIGLTYSSNSMLYLDGQLAATGGPVTIVPATNTWTNGLFVGSDALGYEQARGVFWYLEFDNTNLVEFYGTNHFTENWEWLTNGYDAWLDSLGGGFGRRMMSQGMLMSYSSLSDCITGTNVYLTNVSSTVVPGQGVTFTFGIEGGSNGVPYDIFCTTNLVGPKLTNSVWTWLGQGTNCGMYQVTNQASINSFYVLGTPLLAPDGSGFTVAYEALIPSWHDPEIVTKDDDVVVYGAPLFGSGSGATCPGPYKGIVNYIKSVSQSWGWEINTNATVYTATDTNRTNTKIEYVGAYGDVGCGQTTVTIPYPAVSPVYRFTIYFTNNVPTNDYNITLHGFNP
jgi:hypothetical protein